MKDYRSLAVTGAVIAVAFFGSYLPVLADSDSTGPGGIDSQGLGLTGASREAIGQVEPGRPGLRPLDDPAHSNGAVTPTRVFLRAIPAIANVGTTNHAEEVAGVMIGTGIAAPGVAPGARLFSSATGRRGGQARDARSAQHVAMQNGGAVRAINFSFGARLVGGATLDGNSLLTQFVDWSARVNNTLYVIAGNERQGPRAPVPTDSYNGMTISFSKKNGGVFNVVDPDNDFTEAPTGGRRTVDLVAPGRSIVVPARGDVNRVAFGTSFAAPHVTGTVALLQEFADRQIDNHAPNWHATAHQHEVMKAVLMNSADKIEDDGTVVPRGSLLGMEKTIIDQAGHNWLQSDAFSNRAIPIDAQMGTGQLNASRALTQFTPGEYHSVGSATVPLIGWDYGLLNGNGDINKYVFSESLLGGSFISITIDWDRQVNLTDTNMNGRYNIGETFTSDGLTDLDLYLMPKGATALSQNIWSSISPVDSVEHIFHQIPITGDYEFWVLEVGPIAGNHPFQTYGAAWWAVPAAEPSTILIIMSGLCVLIIVRGLKLYV